MGLLSGRTVGREAGAAAAFNLGLILEEGQDTAGALQAYRDSVELGRLSETGAGREAGAKAAFSLALMLGEAEGPRGSPPGLPGQCRAGAPQRDDRGF